ncbi:MAG TPA: hypothetical protein VKB03_06085 [Conexibacter sp.]|nr:hypothetical protein [Conexibacter sp.]
MPAPLLHDRYPALRATLPHVALDPVYAAKAMAGLLAMVRRGELAGGPILFVATGDALS